MSRSHKAAKNAGTAWETACVKYLAEMPSLDHVERRARRGVRDTGDIAGIKGVVIECKDTTKITPASYVSEAREEAIHAGAVAGVAWFKKRGTVSPGGGYVIMDGETFRRLAVIIDQAMRAIS